MLFRKLYITLSAISTIAYIVYIVDVKLLSDLVDITINKYHAYHYIFLTSFLPGYSWVCWFHCVYLLYFILCLYAFLFHISPCPASPPLLKIFSFPQSFRFHLDCRLIFESSILTYHVSELVQPSFVYVIHSIHASVTDIIPDYLVLYPYPLINKICDPSWL